MTAYENDEIVEHLPNDPLAEIIDTAPIDLVTKLDLPMMKRSHKEKTQTTIKATKMNHRTDIHICFVCSITFPTRSSLNTHQKTIHHQQFECFVCHKSFNRKSNLIAHSRSHTNTKPFRCKYCSLSFQRTTELLKHAIFHTGDTRNQCRQCKLVLSSRERLEKHKRTHAVSANFQCHMCGASGFASKKTLSSHIRLHDRVGDEKFKRTSLINANNKDEVAERTFACEMCKKQFSRKSNFMAHTKRHHSNETEPARVKSHLCCICGKLFSYKTHLIRHLHMHNGVRPYKCEYCGSDFAQRGGLMKHIEKHKRS